ncbi:MAG: hypothetical protein JNJ39_02390 [Blastocatellia bacterium]|nr:hypothetical protein [Blastocatellia bacterium]
MSDIIGINASTASRRYDRAKRRVADDHHMSEAAANVIRQYTVHRA